jgi:TIR domain
MAAGRIFVCYRREDSAGHAGRLYDRLNQRFPGRVFMDVTGIGVGTRWAEVIEQTLRSCEVAVILIGRRWLEQDRAGARRIDDPEDSLRAEIAAALRLGLKIVPLLVAGAAVPEGHDLPPDVAPVLGWQALHIDDDDFDHDASRLVKQLEQQLQEEGTDPHLESAAAKESEIRRLMNHAEAWIARGNWVTAAQALLAVQSLDKANAAAAARLRFVQEQSARNHQASPQVLPSPPVPPKARAVRRTAFGIFGVLGGIGAAAAAVIAVALLVPAGQGQPKPDLHSDPPPARVEDPAPHSDPPPVHGGSLLQRLAGDYDLAASYTLQGAAVPLHGDMRLTPVNDGRFDFEMSVTNPGSGERFQSRGFSVGQGSSWTTTTVQSNDPATVTGPIPTRVSFDGSRLVTQNTHGQVFVWQKR